MSLRENQRYLWGSHPVASLRGSLLYDMRCVHLVFVRDIIVLTTFIADLELMETAYTVRATCPYFYVCEGVTSTKALNMQVHAGI